MKYHVAPTSRFKKEYKRAIKRGLKIEKLHHVVELLAKDLELPESLCDHELKGNWKNHRELHIEGDWLLIYQKKDDVLVLELTRTGSHADLFGK
ncbi:MAG: type II toxin-antitoxin system YafQ family toxin [Treponemataceae bacterium]|nr:type II toxin-antitoxin system YafQ family toxin [Treponemataceae bacterium]